MVFKLEGSVAAAASFFSCEGPSTRMPANMMATMNPIVTMASDDWRSRCAAFDSKVAPTRINSRMTVAMITGMWPCAERKMREIDSTNTTSPTMTAIGNTIGTT